MQLALMLRNNGNLEAARQVLDAMLRDDPRDLASSRLRRSLDQPDGLSSTDPSDNLSDVDQEPNSPFPYISQLLAKDLEKVEFRDEAILAKGGQPDLEDAHRLMEWAERLPKEKPMAERYPLFQEAAKAFTRLPPGTWDPIDFLLAVARYALLKGGALILNFRGQLKHASDQEKLRRLRDSIASYSMETVDVLLQLEAGQRRGRRLKGRTAYTPQSGFVFQALTNHLWAHLAFAHVSGGAPEPPQEDQRHFLRLFEFCLAQPQPELLRLACEPLVASGR